MDLDEILKQVPIDDIAEKFGVSTDVARQAVQEGSAAIVGGLAQNAATPAGSSAIEDALNRHGGFSGASKVDYVDQADGGKIGEYTLDANDSFTMSVDFSNGALGVIHATRWAAGHFNDLRLRIFGDKGGIEVLHTLKGSWLKACTGIHTELAEWEEIDAGKVPTNYERFVAAVKAGKNGEPDFRHAANLQKALDLAFVTERERREAAL